MEKRELQNRDESISQIILAFVVHQDSNAQKNWWFFRPILLKKKSLFDRDLDRRIQSVLMKKDESELRSLSIMKAFGHFWTIRIPMQGTYQSVLNRRVQKQNALDWDFETRNKNILRNVSWNIRKMFKLTAVFRHFRTVKVQMQRTKSITFWMQSSYTTKNCPLRPWWLRKKI